MSGFARGIAPTWGKCSPDKEFRYLRTVIVHVTPHIAMGHGPYLHPLASREEPCVWPLRIPFACSLAVKELQCLEAFLQLRRALRRRPFLLIVRTGRIVTAHREDERVPPDTRRFQHIARFCNGQLLNHRYSYGRRLPGLRFRASPPKRLTLPRNLPAPGRRQCVYIVLRLRTHRCF